jgi:hypothetical protein
MYVFYVDGLKLYNNTFWKSNWLGLAVGPSVTRIEAYNNIVQCIDYTFMGGTYSSAQHTWDYNLVGFTGRGLAAQAHDVVNSDPKFRGIPTANDNTSAHMYRNVTASDFELMAGSPAIGKGISGSPVPTVDFYGRPRTPPCDMGAIGYQSISIRPANASTQSAGSCFRFPSIVHAKQIAAYSALAHVHFYDLYGRKIDAVLGGRGCLLLKTVEGGVRRIAVMP